MSDFEMHDSDDDPTPEEIEQARQEWLEEDRRRRAEFADDAEARGLVYYADAGMYADENGNAVNDYGERI